MPHGNRLSDDARWIIVNLAMHFDIKTIVSYSGCKQRTIERIIADYRKRGTVDHEPSVLQGGRRALRPADV